MDEIPPSDLDPFDDLLRRPASSSVSADLREAVAQITGRVLRRRRWLRRSGIVAALAACYAAGLATPHFGRPEAPRSSDTPVAQRTPDQPHPSTPSNPAPPSVQQAAASPESSALALEWKALDSPVARPDLFRQAGDRYLEEAGDYESALRCYRTVLNASEEQCFSADDSWLLMALKEARRKEKRHDQTGG